MATPPEAAVPAGTAPESVGALSELYLGNLLYAIERCALALDDEGKGIEAAFYRGLGRKLAEARGRSRFGPESPPAAS